MAPPLKVKKKKSGVENYNTYGIVLIAVSAMIVYGSTLVVGQLTEYKAEMENLQMRYEGAKKKKETVQQKLRTRSRDMRVVAQEAKHWKGAEAKLVKPWTINAAEWLVNLGKQQSPPVLSPGPTTKAGKPGKPGSIEMDMIGSFTSLLNWLMQAEHELDQIRVTSAKWEPQDQKTIRLSVVFEVAYE